MQVHAQQHLRPVLRLGAAGTGLHVEIGVVGVHLAGEHALELHVVGQPGVERDIPGHCGHGGLVVLVSRHLQQIGGISQPGLGAGDRLQHLLQLGPLAAQVLGAFRVVPDLVVLQLRRYLDQAVTLDIVVKDSPAARRNALAGP